MILVEIGLLVGTLLLALISVVYCAGVGLVAFLLLTMDSQGPWHWDRIIDVAFALALCVIIGLVLWKIDPIVFGYYLTHIGAIPR